MAVSEPQTDNAAPSPEPFPTDVSVVVVELLAGRSSGHNNHYLNSLETALAAWDLTVWAPYRDGSAKTGRIRSLVHQFQLMWRALHPKSDGIRVVVAQNPWAIEKGVVALSSLLRPRRAIAAFVLRRTGPDAHARAHPLSAIANRAGDAGIKAAIRRGWLYPISDSRLALEYWQRRSRVSIGSVVALPPLPGGDMASRPVRAGGPSIALIGAFRTERGAAHYDTIIEASVELLGDATVHVQLGGQPQDGSLELAEAIRRRWRDDPRVRIHEGHLSDEEYAAVLMGADVVVLPYDAASYTTGTSGVLHEAVTAGASVLTAPLAWALREYGNEPRVRFLDAWDRETIRRELPLAASSAVEARDSATPAPDDAFARSWHEALAAAAARLRARA